MNLQAVIYFIGGVLVLTVAGIIYLTSVSDRPIPDILVAIASGALTGLIGLLVPTKTGA